MTQDDLELIQHDVGRLPEIEGSHYGREEEKVFGALRSGFTAYISSDKATGGFKINPQFEKTHQMLQRWALDLTGRQEIGRAYYFSLPPHKTVSLHIDAGPYFGKVDRFTMACNNPPGALFLQEGYMAETMKVLHFDPREPHSLINGSAERWTFLVFDVLK